jgi:ribosomal protein L11 methyltransferase
LRYPALDVVHADSDLVLAVVDDYSPTAVEERDGLLTIFFSDRVRRDSARDAIADAWPLTITTPREVDDGDWARRSQQDLKPVTVGRITLFPDSQAPPPASGSPIAIVILPSMGFGTGHHATTRLCLAALQAIDLTGTFVVDVGTGSGVLAIAARLLGADGSVGIDNDPDAVQAAQTNLVVNPGVDGVAFEEADLKSWLPARVALVRERGPGLVVTANLTGALLIREAASLAAGMLAGGSLIVGGLLAAERREVVDEFERAADLRVVWESQEEGWVGLVFKSQVSSPTSQVPNPEAPVTLRSDFESNSHDVSALEPWPPRHGDVGACAGCGNRRFDDAAGRGTRHAGPTAWPARGGVWPDRGARPRRRQRPPDQPRLGRPHGAGASRRTQGADR